VTELAWFSKSFESIELTHASVREHIIKRKVKKRLVSKFNRGRRNSLGNLTSGKGEKGGEDTSGTDEEE
jgi:hypothetical protein